MTWGIYRGDGIPVDRVGNLPDPPSWRIAEENRGSTYRPNPEEIELVNAAFYLRRPLFITGKPGIGKTSLAYAVAHELKLGKVLRWSVTTRSTLTEGLYSYDAIGRLQEANLSKLKQGDSIDLPVIGKYIRLGPLGTALLPLGRPRVLLVDEIDKSDIDLPNDLLHVFEEGEFVIPELARLSDSVRTVDMMTWDGEHATIEAGVIRCKAFPFVVFTSNGEREFPPAFLRRCLRLTMQPPEREKLIEIVSTHMQRYTETYPVEDASTKDILEQAKPLIEEFLKRRDKGDLATDQLLNAIYLVTQNVDPLSRKTLCDAVFRALSS